MLPTIFGTTHTDASPVVYKTVFATPSGAVGFRNLGDGVARVRVQLFNTAPGFRAALAAKLPGWKRPSSLINEQRHSTMAYSDKERDAALVAARAALAAADTIVSV
jgi:hypothetical protein